MKLPNDEAIAMAKSAARAASGADGVELLQFPDLDVAVIARPLTQAEFSRYIDERMRNEDDAKVALFATHVLWPLPNDADALRGELPALPYEVARELERIAGVVPGEPSVEVLTKQTPPATFTAIGLSAETAAELLQRYSGPRQLSIVRLPRLDFAAVMKRPTAALYDATKERVADAQRAGKGFWGVCQQATIDTVVWCCEPIGDVLARYPALPTSDLIGVFFRLGGAGARCERKSL
jgi:hypothetical protein